MTERILAMLMEIHPYEQITTETKLVESGILDSMTIIGLVTLLEEEFGIEIADDAVTKENFETLQKIEELVQSSIKV